MSIVNKHTKTVSSLLIAFLMSTLGMSALKADTAAPGAGGGELTYLQEIAQYTNGTLVAVNNLPQTLSALTALAMNWMNPDTSTPTTTLQASFSTYAAQTAASKAAQTALQQQLITDFFGSTPPDYANDLAYQTLIGIPVLPKDPKAGDTNSGYNFLKNASGLNMSHTAPAMGWRGNVNDQRTYANYYSSISAVQTYNAYVLSQLYTDSKQPISATQNALIQQSSDSKTWFAQVAAEPIGVVLRQILMYNSQQYILTAQLLQTEKQVLATNAMTNTLLILSNRVNEGMLLKKALMQVNGI